VTSPTKLRIMWVGAEAIPAERLTVLERDHGGAPEEIAARVRLGPMLAVCGLTGGAGATTLAYLVALAAAHQEAGPVLVADTGGPSGGLAALAGVATPHSLVELAGQLVAGLPLEGVVYATGPAGVRVIATGPEFTATGADDRLVRLLIDAREAHRLTVIDCGTLARVADRVALAAATHVVWVLPATVGGISRGRRVLDAAPASAAKQLLIGRRDVRQSKAPLGELQRVANESRTPLVLVPHLPGLEAGKLAGAVDAVQVPVQAILGALRR
jgi:MinD-like ATPase involved in chromosome partitioning or flagellar assembly